MDRTGVLESLLDRLIRIRPPQNRPGRSPVPSPFTSLYNPRATLLGLLLVDSWRECSSPTVWPFSETTEPSTRAIYPGIQGRVAFTALTLHNSPLARDQLAELVWGDEELPGAWSAALSSLISKIRRLLQQTGLDPRQVLVQSSGTYQLVLPADFWVDVEDATRRLDRAEGSLRHGDVVTAVAETTVVTAVFRRPFLPGALGRWVETVRERHLDALYRSYEVLAEGWRERGDAGLAAKIAQDAIEIDPYRESAYRLLMQAEVARGDRAAAIRAYRQCRQVLQVELGLEPSPATEAVNRSFSNG